QAAPAFRLHMSVATPSSNGLPSGRRQYDGITITKEFGASDPQYLQALANNESLSVTMKFVRAPQSGPGAGSGQVQTFQTMTLTEASVAKVERATIKLDDAAGRMMFADEITFRFKKIKVEDTSGTLFEDTVGP